MRTLTTRLGGGERAFALPALVLGVLIVYFGLLPAHVLPAHGSNMGPASTDSPSPAAVQAASPGDRAHAHEEPAGAGGHKGQQHGDAPPFCHDSPEISWAAGYRSCVDKPEGLLLWLALIVTMFAVGLFLRTWPGPRHPRWCTRPPWRPAGIRLLTQTCVSRT